MKENKIKFLLVLYGKMAEGNFSLLITVLNYKKNKSINKSRMIGFHEVFTEIDSKNSHKKTKKNR